jgi:ATP-dependent helicase/nuclease subunit A
VRRQAGGAGEGEGMIRVMTVHGSKGLESPIVIMPDTAKRRPPREAWVVPGPDGLALWRGNKDERAAPVKELVENQARRQLEERKRLLYVGLTRAESWLIVAAAGVADAESWHGMVAAGFDRSALPQSRIPTPLGEIRRLQWGDWPEAAPDDSPRRDRPPVATPDWLAAPLPAIRATRRPVAATSLGGAKVIAGGAGDSDAAMLFGTRLHLLLEHLPGRDPAEWPVVAGNLLAGSQAGLPEPDELARLLAEARAVAEAPELAQVFILPEDSELFQEISLAAPLPGIGMVLGRIDRLVITADRVLAVDFKSNREVPARPEAVPQGILRQMAAYRAALQAIWPGHRIEVAVLWTATRSLMPLSNALLDLTLAALDPDGAGA